jgi:outer membrane receptor protein involved in Fe transport
MLTHTTRLSSLALALLLPVTLAAQQVAQPGIDQLATSGTIAPAAPAIPVTTTPSTPTPTTPTDEIVELEVFRVDAEKDEGYQALNTASGSRINTPLRDTPASISVFTNQFLQDIGASTIDDMLAYGANIEQELDDQNNAFNNVGADDSANSDNRFRIRGMSMTTAINGVETSFAQDTYNIDRAEISSGPNSNLFGMALPGGVIALASKRANLQRNSTNNTTAIGTWNNLGEPWNLFRTTIDHNIVLMPKKLGIRLLGVYQDGNSTSWRYWMKNRTKRINPVLTFKPFKKTTIHLSYEVGGIQAGFGPVLNPGDRVMGWLTSGRQIMESFPATGVAIPNGTTSGPATDRYVFVTNDSSLWNYASTLRTISAYKDPGGGEATGARMPAELASYGYSIRGPGGTRDQNFDSFQIVLEQRIGNLDLQFGYFHNKNVAITHSQTASSAVSMSIWGDPNRFITAVDGNSARGTAYNTRAGQLYMESNWQLSDLMQSNNVIRFTASYSANLKKFGRHRLVANLDRAMLETYNNRYAELLVGNDHLAINQSLGGTANPATNTNDNPNFLFRRQYLTEGDFTTYYSSDWRAPFEPFYLNGKRYHAQYVAHGGNQAHTKRYTDSASATLVTYWLDDKLVTTAGFSMSDSYKRIQTTAPIRDINDPRILDGSRIFYENVLTDIWRPLGRWEPGSGQTIWTPSPRQHTRPFNYTLGAVYHATNRLSAFINHSTNTDTGNPNNRAVLPYGDDAPPSEGKTIDYGILIDLSGRKKSQKATLRLTRFDTRNIHQLIVRGNGTVTDISNRLQRIFTALNSTGAITEEEYIGRTPTKTFEAGMTDGHSRGFEAELTANLSRSFTMRLAASYTDQAKENLFAEILDYFNANIPGWMKLADPSRNQSGEDFYYGGTTLYQYIINQLYTPGSMDTTSAAAGSSVRDDLGALMLTQTGNQGSRPLKFNLMAKYTFLKGTLKGLSVSGNLRYSDPPRLPDPLRLWSMMQTVTQDDHPNDLCLDPKVFTDAGTMIKGNSATFWGAMAAYKVNLLGGRVNANLQFNIDNIFNANRVQQGQYWRSDGSNDELAYLRRVYMFAPRAFKLTARFDF